MPAQYFVTGIGADVGKTLVAAILAEAMGADYWKPVQTGNVGFTDSDVVRSLVSNPFTKVHPEAYKFRENGTPSTAAKNEGIAINITAMRVPDAPRGLIIEGSGGVLVPLCGLHTSRDLITHIGAPVIVVARNYLGSVNHALLTIEALAARKILMAGLIFNGESSPDSESYILEHSGLELLGRVGVEEMIDQLTVKRYAAQFREKFKPASG